MPGPAGVGFVRPGGSRYLDSVETAALSALVDRWWSRVVLRTVVSRLWLLGARDDLVLDAEVIAHLPLT